MDLGHNVKRAKIVSRVLAILIGAFGLYLIISWVILPLLRNYPVDEPFWDIIFILVFPISVFVFGCYCIFAALKLWSDLSVVNVQRISIVGAFMLFFILIGTLYPLLQGSLWGKITLPLLVIPAGVFYWMCNKWLLKWLGLPDAIDWYQHEKSVKHFFAWLAFFLWSGFIGVLIELAQRYEFLDFSKAPWLHTIVLLGPLFLAYLIYRFGVRIALRDRPADSFE